MARGYSIWVVTSALYGNPITAFTVKHELKDWLLRENILDGVVIWKLRDGWWIDPVKVDIKELLS